MEQQTQTPIPGNHQMGKNLSNNPAGYTPTEDEKKAIKMVEKLFSKAKEYRKNYDEKWLDWYRMFRGKQWKEARPSYRHSEVINLIFRAIQAEVPIMTDTRPKIEFVPQEPNDAELATILNELADYDWNTNNWLYQLTEIIYDAHLYGTGFGCMEYDPTDKNGMGNAHFASKDPFYSYPDPDAYDVNVRGRFFIYAEPMDVGKIKKMYPDKKEFIQPDVIDFSRKDKINLDQVKYKSPTDNRTILEGRSTFDLESQDQALLVYCYSKDDEFLEDEIDDEKTGQKNYVQRLKYPRGRLTIVCNGVLLEDGPNPYEDGKFPYAKMSNYILPREFWGMSEVEQLESPQKIFNKLISFSLDVLTLMGNPIWIVGKDSEVDTDQLYNRPGLIIEKNPGSEVRREEGVQLQPYVLQIIDRMEKWFNDVSGSQDVSRGQRPEGITAASAITALQDASQTRVRQKTRNMDAFLQNIGQMYLSRVFQFYDAPRVVRITNQDGAQKYFKFHIEKQIGPDGEETKVARYRGLVKNEKGPVYAEQEKLYQMQGEFDVKVSTGSSLPFAIAQKEGKALKLFELGIVDAEEVLKALDYPNRELVLSRMAQKKEAAAMAEAQGAPPPPV